MSAPLTKAQAKVLRYVFDFRERFGYPPTRAEIARAMRFCPNAAQDHLLLIQGKGCLIVQKHVARGLVITPLGEKALSELAA